MWNFAQWYIVLFTATCDVKCVSGQDLESEKNLRDETPFDQCQSAVEERMPCDPEVNNDLSTEECLSRGCCWGRCDMCNSVAPTCFSLNGQVRLSGGILPNSGRVEVFYDGVWGSVCNDGWNFRSAKVVCRQLGFGGSNVIPATGEFATDSFSGSIHVDNVECSGDEEKLFNCRRNPVGTEDCDHSEDVSMVCNIRHGEGALRLTGGISPASGRVEMFRKGSWGSVCDNNWDIYDAEVVCRELGNYGGWPLLHSAFGPAPSILPVWLDSVNCEGHETRLTDCEAIIEGKARGCSHRKDAAVVCESDAHILLNEGGLRIMADTHIDEDGKIVAPLRGRVQIHHTGSWGDICAHSLGKMEAMVACRQLGFRGGEVFVEHESKPSQVWLNEVSCIGHEHRLNLCTLGAWGGHTCDGGQLAAVSCEEIPIINHVVIPKVRLAGDEYWKGRVEVEIQGRWGTVCNDGWDNMAATVLCRQLGFLDGLISLKVPRVPVNSMQPIWMDEINCNGNETRIDQCDRADWGHHDCTHGEDAGVICNRGFT